MGRPKATDTEAAAAAAATATVETSSSDDNESTISKPAIGSTDTPHFPAATKAHEATVNHNNHQTIGKPWTTRLFDCGDSETNIDMVTAYCPCVAFGQIAEMLDEGQTSCTLASFMYLLSALALCSCSILGAHYRQQLRQKYDLVQAPAGDCSVHLFCPCCALHQEYRELQSRGIDPSLGWMGYLAQQQETKTLPPNGQSMEK